jgi:hypothetical protein
MVYRAVLSEVKYMIDGKKYLVKEAYVNMVCAGGLKEKEPIIVFCVGRFIGTHAPCSSAYLCEQYSSYNEAVASREIYGDDSKYYPILGITKEGFSYYLPE